MFTVEFCIHRSPPTIVLGNPHDELPILKHRQLACQIGAFGAIAFESSVDLKINAIHGNLISHSGVLQYPNGLDITTTLTFQQPMMGLYVSSN
jgi:hypothetical protein